MSSSQNQSSIKKETKKKLNQPLLSSDKTSSDVSTYDSILTSSTPPIIGK